MLNSEIQKEIENVSSGGDGGGFDLNQVSSANTAAIESGKRLVNPREFLTSRKNKSEAESFGQRRELILEECCKVEGIDIRSFDISEMFSLEEREEVIDDFCTNLGRHDLISKNVSKPSNSFVQPTLGAFRNLRDDLRAEDTRGNNPHTEALKTISEVERLLNSTSNSEDYVLLEGDNDDESDEGNFSVAFRALFTIVRRDDAKNAETFASNFPRAVKNKACAQRLIDLEKDIMRAHASFEAQRAIENRVDDLSPQERSEFRTQIRQQLAGPYQDLCFPLSLKRRLFNIIDEIGNLPSEAHAEEVSVEASTLIPDAGIRASIAAKSAKAVARSTAPQKSEYESALSFALSILPASTVERIQSVPPTASEMSVKQAAFSTEQRSELERLGKLVPTPPMKQAQAEIIAQGVISTQK